VQVHAQTAGWNRLAEAVSLILRMAKGKYTRQSSTPPGQCSGLDLLGQDA